MKKYLLLHFVGLLFAMTYPVTKSVAQQGHFVGTQLGISRTQLLAGRNSFETYSPFYAVALGINYEYHQESPLYFGLGLHIQSYGANVTPLVFEKDLDPTAGFLGPQGELFHQRCLSIPIKLGYSEMFGNKGFFVNMAAVPTVALKTEGNPLGYNSNGIRKLDVAAQMEAGVFLLSKEKWRISPSLGFYRGFISRHEDETLTQTAVNFLVNVQYKIK